MRLDKVDADMFSPVEVSGTMGYSYEIRGQSFKTDADILCNKPMEFSTLEDEDQIIRVT